MIAIIDYDAGNIKSVEKAFAYLGYETKVTRDAQEILSADKVVLPGVGSFGDAMNHLKQYQLDTVIQEVASSGKPFLGICLGLQLLFESSEETPGVAGLGILPGRIVRFSDDMGLKIPHIGWNSLHLQHEGRLFRGIFEQSFVYYVHSYYLQAADESIVTATSDYGATIHGSVESGNIFACQFHPEKSGTVGLQILKNFCEL
ncbi:MAG: imidazole glycerol phosphate synthase subunit HisH [Lachnospiraceae bacterium]|nr:imidazole glycerol phosphate synthase subunit HisH [Lachnospiraceae bacterium]